VPGVAQPSIPNPVAIERDRHSRQRLRLSFLYYPFTRISFNRLEWPGLGPDPAIVEGLSLVTTSDARNGWGWTHRNSDLGNVHDTCRKGEAHQKPLRNVYMTQVSESSWREPCGRIVDPPCRHAILSYMAPEGHNPISVRGLSVLLEHIQLRFVLFYEWVAAIGNIQQDFAFAYTSIRRRLNVSCKYFWARGSSPERCKAAQNRKNGWSYPHPRNR
jgi:hypothetical protein